MYNLEGNRFISVRIIDGKPRKVIVDELGKIISKNPSKDELKYLGKFSERDGRSNPRRGARYTKKQIIGDIIQFYKNIGRVPTTDDFNENPSRVTIQKIFGSWNNAIIDAGLWKKRYNPAHTCDRCGKSFDDVEKAGGYPFQECDRQGNWTGNWDCRMCWERYDVGSITNIRKSIANCRTGNQNKKHESTKGDLDVDLACELYGYVNLNKKYDNFNTEIDCLDEKTGLLYQVKGRRYNPKYRSYHFSNINNEWYKEYEDMIFFCKSEDGKSVEEIYRMPLKVIKEKKMTGVNIFRYDIRGNPYEDGWYEEYRIKNLKREEELKMANEILRRLEEN